VNQKKNKKFFIWLYWQTKDMATNDMPLQVEFHNRKEASVFIDALEQGGITNIWVACTKKELDGSVNLKLFGRTALGWIRGREMEARLNPIMPPTKSIGFGKVTVLEKPLSYSSNTKWRRAGSEVKFTVAFPKKV